MSILMLRRKKQKNVKRLRRLVKDLRQKPQMILSCRWKK